MRKFIQKKFKDQKGMTLIELLAVIVIIAIIAAIAIPAIGGVIDNSRVGAIKSDAQNVISAGELYFIDAPTETAVELSELVTLGFVDDVGSFEGALATGGAGVQVSNKVAAAGTDPAKPVTITGIGTTGKIEVEFTGATRDQIGAYGNSTREANAEDTITASKE